MIKINDSLDSKVGNAKLILVTSMNPTPYGEGKTTVSIGVSDALNKLNQNAILALREPSKGPVFGMKGGATGGGETSLIPSLDIDLNFNGDFDAITTANNLVSATIDNEIYWNKRNVTKIVWKRCIDMCDRYLRADFDITAASEMMSIFVMSKNFKDLENRLDNAIVAYDNETPITIKDLKITKALLSILENSFKPNMVQTKGGSLCLIHGGPFANISLGTSSIHASRVASNLGEYVIQEAGFGSDLGAEKFINLYSRESGMDVYGVVMVITPQAIKHHGNGDLNTGMENVMVHINNVKKWNKDFVVAINKIDLATQEEIDFCINYLDQRNIKWALSNGYNQGGDGCLDLAKKVTQLEHFDTNYNYDTSDDIFTKIKKVVKEVYGGVGIAYSDKVYQQLLDANDCKYICMSKTHASLSDTASKLNAPKDFVIKITDVKVLIENDYAIIYSNNVITMPGLSKVPRSENWDRS